ncbi:right-handed parallel beta-helix repeat-containing protein [Roseateles cellulosilyticus]|uniref:Right-handed parallel beta-helix repeat-containing protein n=1 Tax=Pelomonas cellulosilytica TaxID=2906762 RepID=A0ABS8XVR5_9BURK|nr:right-handed parallel beta-helix repeat-containing protein [Pelomonas sp. P8]MCE4555877.1 right-handed parallel beta-helix repeat-containing protein [Pelomonas sp. P8]
MTTPFRIRRWAAALGLLAAPWLAGPATAQPSGGPYGPVPQRYAVPKAAHVYYVAPDGQADAAGTQLNAPTTIEAAIARVVTGDVIVMRGGTYRTGGLELNQGIAIQPYLDEKPVLKGTRVAADWEALPHGVWRTKWATLFPAGPLGWWQRKLEGTKTPLHRFNNDMVFVDGEALASAGWEGELAGGKSFYVDYDKGYVYIGVNPAGRTVEITAHDIALHRPSRPVNGKAPDRIGPQLRGLTFTQYAYRAIDIEGKKPSTPVSEEPTDDPVGPSPESAHGKEVVGTLLENVTISHCSRVAGYFRGDKLVIRNSLISDTGTEGIYVIGSSDALLERNLIRRNNVEKLTGYYPSAVKIFNQSYRVTVRDNLIVEQPYSNGVWYDVGNIDGVFVNNYVEGAMAGLFFEISKGITVAGNVFVNNQQGVRILNSAGAKVLHNTFVNSQVLIDRNERSAQGDHFGWHPQTGPDVNERVGHVFEGNLLVADASVKGPLLRFEQAPVTCGQVTQAPSTRVDGNVYLRAGTGQPLVSWAPVTGSACQATYATLEEFRQGVPGVEAVGRAFIGDDGTVFRSVELRRFELARVPDGVQPLPVSPELRRLLGWPEARHLPGALPAVSPR